MLGKIIVPFRGGGVFGKLEDGVAVGSEFTNSVAPETNVFEPEVAVEVDVVPIANVEDAANVDFGVWAEGGNDVGAVRRLD